MKLKDAYLKTSEILKNEGIDTYLSDARFLISSFLNKDYSYIILNPDEEFDFDKFEPLLKRRVLGEPCQYIVGKTEFMGLTFKVDKRVLVPRQDTEVLIEEILTSEKDFLGDILDICTGSGCIAISLKKFLKNAKADALDISEDALNLAKENAKLNDAEINFFKEDILKKTEFTKKYDIIVSNPPYIKSSDVLDLMPTVKDFEPRLALDGGFDGLLFYKKIISLLKQGLKKGGRVYFEIGFDQGAEVKSLLDQNGFCDIEIIKDYSGRDRVVKGKML